MKPTENNNNLIPPPSSIPETQHPSPFNNIHGIITNPLTQNHYKPTITRHTATTKTHGQNPQPKAHGQIPTISTTSTTHSPSPNPTAMTWPWSNLGERERESRVPKRGKSREVERGKARPCRAKKTSINGAGDEWRW
jgi:hypothetical protein